MQGQEERKIYCINVSHSCHISNLLYTLDSWSLGISQEKKNVKVNGCHLHTSEYKQITAWSYQGEIQWNEHTVATPLFEGYLKKKKD